MNTKQECCEECRGLPIDKMGDEYCADIECPCHQQKSRAEQNHNRDICTASIKDPPYMHSPNCGYAHPFLNTTLPTNSDQNSNRLVVPSRAELIEEIVGEFEQYIRKVYSRGHIPDYAMDTIAPIVGKAREILLRISDASMDAVEVEVEDGAPDAGSWSKGWNAAITDSREKRALFI